MEITYGHRIDSLQDPYVKLAQHATEATVRAGSPGSMLVDFFPVCTSLFFVFAFCSARTGADGETRTSVKKLPTWMPGAGFKRDAFRIRELVHEMMDTPYEMVKGAMVSFDGPMILRSELADPPRPGRGHCAAVVYRFSSRGDVRPQWTFHGGS